MSDKMPDMMNDKTSDKMTDETTNKTNKTTGDVPAKVTGKPSDMFAVPELHQDKAPRVKALAVVLVLLASMSAGFLGGWVGANRSNESDNLSGAAQQRIVTNESQLINDIADTVGPSVVSIDVTSEREGAVDFFGFSSGPSQSRSAGTGIILTGNGLVVTNRHVVPEGTTSLSVTLSDGTQLDQVEVVGRTRDTDPLDIAFLKITDTEGKKLTSAKIGDSSKIGVGDRVVAIGNALGQFQNTVTSGIISGYGRNVQAGGGSNGEVESLQDLFQTDAAINQGNSGGPLVNSNGEVIGINTAIAGGDAQGIGFAIPVNNISGLIKNVISTGEFKQPYLGVRYVPLTNDVAQQFDLDVNRGAYILPESETDAGIDGPQTQSSGPSILPGSPAEKAGLRPGDIISQVNGTKVDERHSLTALLQRSAIGETVTLKIIRDGKEQDVKVKLEELPASQR